MCSHPHSHDPDHGHAHGHHAPGAEDRFRVVITGKGGVGKTTLTALLARRMARNGLKVLALDADPQMNLPHALGLPPAEVRKLVPISQNAEYVAEKTGAMPGSGFGRFFRLNPEVDDVVDRFGVVGPDGVRVLVMGSVVQPAAGCLCPENALLAAVAGSVSLRENEAILMDTQAGVEHFGRALAQGFRHAAIVTDPTFNGVQVALHAARLAGALGIPAIRLVVNRVGDPEEYDRTLALLDEEGGFPFASRHALPFDGTLRACDPAVEPMLARPSSGLLQSLMALQTRLIQSTGVCRT
uniref:CO dehydrogenase maturation factor n=1 Tax=Candidatus Kentrum eta TaxID=2126337 RepID=A0A450UUN7_9GAMM|nr:MAG: CO dehydrogenase maturation factor [Candidatus Kentron sp. H]VFJ96274.1 MAG: CO dehydrogenase maturation factor [Candidatus Kentron sp. H]VFK02392.1 MAG: CO dehydrogenase maturation factor [Candidatus Kentron sp. H]